MHGFPLIQILTETLDPSPRLRVVHRRCLGVSLGWQLVRIEGGEETELAPIRSDQRDAERDLEEFREHLPHGAG